MKGQEKSLSLVFGLQEQIKAGLESKVLLKEMKALMPNVDEGILRKLVKDESLVPVFAVAKEMFLSMCKEMIPHKYHELKTAIERGLCGSEMDIWQFIQENESAVFTIEEYMKIHEELNGFYENRGGQLGSKNVSKTAVQKIKRSLVRGGLGVIILCKVHTPKGIFNLAGPNPKYIPNGKKEALVICCGHTRTEALRQLYEEGRRDIKVLVAVIAEEDFMAVYEADENRRQHNVKEAFVMRTKAIGKVVLPIIEEIGWSPCDKNWGAVLGCFAYADTEMAEKDYKRIKTFEDVIKDPDAEKILKTSAMIDKDGPRNKKEWNKDIEIIKSILDGCHTTSIHSITEQFMQISSKLPHTTEVVMKNRSALVTAAKSYRRLMKVYDATEQRKVRMIARDGRKEKMCRVYGKYSFCAVYLYNLLYGGRELANYSTEDLAKRMNVAYDYLKDEYYIKRGNLASFRKHLGPAIYASYIKELIK